MDSAVTCFFSITYSTLRFTLSLSYIRNFPSGSMRLFTESAADGQATKYSESGSPAVHPRFRHYKAWHKKLNRRYANWKAANRHLLMPVSSPRLSSASGGESFQLITVPYLMSSLSQIKRRRRDEPTGSKVREEKDGNRQRSEADRGGCDREDETVPISSSR